MVAPVASASLGEACRGDENMWHADSPVTSPSRGGGRTHSNSRAGSEQHRGRSGRSQRAGRPAACPARGSLGCEEAIPGLPDPTTCRNFRQAPGRHFTYPSCSHLPSGPARSLSRTPLPLRGLPHPGCPGRSLRAAPAAPAAARPPFAHGPPGLARGRVCAGKRRGRQRLPHAHPGAAAGPG